MGKIKNREVVTNDLHSAARANIGARIFTAEERDSVSVFFFKQGADVEVNEVEHDVLVFSEEVEDIVTKICVDWHILPSGKPLHRDGFVYQRVYFGLLRVAVLFTRWIFSLYDQVIVSDEIDEAHKHLLQLGGEVKKFPDDCYRCYLAYVLLYCEFVAK